MKKVVYIILCIDERSITNTFTYIPVTMHTCLSLHTYVLCVVVLTSGSGRLSGESEGNVNVADPKFLNSQKHNWLSLNSKEQWLPKLQRHLYRNKIDTPFEKS